MAGIVWLVVVNVWLVVVSNVWLVEVSNVWLVVVNVWLVVGNLWLVVVNVWLVVVIPAPATPYQRKWDTYGPVPSWPGMQTEQRDLGLFLLRGVYFSSFSSLELRTLLRKHHSPAPCDISHTVPQMAK